MDILPFVSRFVDLFDPNQVGLVPDQGKRLSLTLLRPWIKLKAGRDSCCADRWLVVSLVSFLGRQLSSLAHAQMMVSSTSHRPPRSSASHWRLTTQNVTPAAASDRGFTRNIHRPLRLRWAPHHTPPGLPAGEWHAPPPPLSHGGESIAILTYVPGPLLLDSSGCAV